MLCISSILSTIYNVGKGYSQLMLPDWLFVLCLERRKLWINYPGFFSWAVTHAFLIHCSLQANKQQELSFHYIRESLSSGENITISLGVGCMIVVVLFNLKFVFSLHYLSSMLGCVMCYVFFSFSPCTVACLFNELKHNVIIIWLCFTLHHPYWVSCIWAIFQSEQNIISMLNLWQSWNGKA